MSDDGFEFMLRRRVEALVDGTYGLNFSDEERGLLRTLPSQLRDLLHADDREDPAVQRLFPPAYRKNEDHEEEYQGLMRGDLLDQRLGALSVLEETIDADTLSEDELVAWMAVVNDLRLVLGVRLDVTEDMYADGLPPNDPRTPAFELFSYLGLLMEQFVEALSGE